MPTYTHDERARARFAVRQLNQLATEAKQSASRGIILPDEVTQAIVGLTNTGDKDRQIDALVGLSERLRNDHLKKLKEIAKDNFSAFCEYVNPDEPPESKWHIWLTDDLLQKVDTDPTYQNIVLNCPPGHAKPLAGDTLVLMGNGALKRLDAVRIGDSVITHEGRARQVTEVHSQGKLPCVKIITKGGRCIVAALDHPFMLEDGSYKNAVDLRPNDPLKFGLKIADATPGDEALRDIYEFEFAAHFGALGGRTYHADRKKTKYYRNVFLWTGDSDTHSKMISCLTHLKVPHETWQNAGDGFHYIRLKTSYGDKLAAPFFIDNEATEREVPAFVFEGSHYQIKHFVSTFISHRGIIGKKYLHPRLAVEVRSRVYAQQVQSLLSRYGVQCQYVETGNKAPTAKLILSAPDLEAYFEAGFTFDGDTKDRFQSKRNVEAYGTSTSLDPVHTVKSMDEPEECYCLTVDEDHTFVANDVIVHNSTYASRLFVAWRMGRRPKEIVIGGGHTQTFVENEFSKRIRDLVGSPAYHDVFPEIVISSSTRGAGQWNLAGTTGKYVARGAGQGVHGFRANFICVDDPYAKVEDADSATVREKVKTWFFTDLGSRLLPNATQFVIMTRFHEDDLTGSIIEVNKLLPVNERYRIVEAPGICYDPDNDILSRTLGEVLWNFYKITHYTNLRLKWSFQRFALIIQQSAEATDEATVASKLKFYKQAPHLTERAIRQASEKNQRDDAGRVRVDKRDWYSRIIVSVDTAATKTERADWTVVQVWGRAHDGMYYLLDQRRKKVQFNEMVTMIEKPARDWGADAILVEDKGQGTAYLQFRGKTEAQKRQAPCPLVAIKVDPKQGKEFRFDEISPMIEAGEVWAPELADWTTLFVRELGQFPDGAHDDQVDAMSQALRYFKSKRKSKYGSRPITGMG